MAKIQARNVDDALYQRIEQSAMKNERSLEGEIRMALAAAYPPPGQNGPVLSERACWQQETGRRLRWLFDRLIADNCYRASGRADKAGIPELVKLARQLDTSPGLLMDIMEGNKELPFHLADAIAENFDASAGWLLDGRETPFPVADLGMDYHGFFLPAGDNARYAFEFIRISRGRHEGTLICLRIHPQTGRMALGTVTAEFNLCKDGSGGTGHGKLLAFMLFLKESCAHCSMNAFDWEVDDSFDFWSVVGQHHPVYFQDFRRRATSGWLQQVFTGQDPDGWFSGCESDLEEIRDMPFGGPKNADSDISRADVAGVQTV
ncbi:FitA-like ribbon-helix-helix domain-containing protein [Pantoea septica]|uniref:FitA-like ribbon-helix-helix domain-containing protein n=1 Tax=Pantoea septica TaxID=472695 RepID=UPI003D0416B2